MRITIDRFESDYAICEIEAGKFIDVPRAEIPKEAKEGDILSKTGTGYRIEKTETDEKRKEIKKRMDKLFAD